EQHKVHTAKGYQILPRLSMDCFSCLCDEPRICVFDDVSELAKAFGTISYEILTHLSPSIKRTII
ncbi:MAG TPA: alanine racemase, partial [Helicobacter sp.]|nr:alanine racemase [Helicobacter sp.]